jgi:hypothetical protein
VEYIAYVKRKKGESIKFSGKVPKKELTAASRLILAAGAKKLLEIAFALRIHSGKFLIYERATMAALNGFLPLYYSALSLASKF